MSAEVSDWLLDGINPDTLESDNDISILSDVDTYYDYVAYNVVYTEYNIYAEYYYDYYNYSVYYDYYNYSVYYDYYDYYNYSNSISVTLHPISQSVLVNETVSFVVRASNTIDSCQWYYATTATGAGTLITGATSPTYTLVANTSLDGRYYYCTVRRGGNTSTSSRALLTVRSLTVYDIYVSVGSTCQMMFVRANPPTTTITGVTVVDSNIATVTATGEITGVSIGSTDVTVTGSNSATAVFKIIVIEDALVATLMNTAIAIREYKGITGSIYPNQMANRLKDISGSESYSTLEELFTDIADTIRNIDGSIEEILPCDFYTRILSLGS